jgi:hypothetical protein
VIYWYGCYKKRTFHLRAPRSYIHTRKAIAAAFALGSASTEGPNARLAIALTSFVYIFRMLMAHINGRYCIPWQFIQIPFTVEVTDVRKLHRELSIVPWSRETVATKIDRCCNGGLRANDIQPSAIISNIQIMHSPHRTPLHVLRTR